VAATLDEQASPAGDAAAATFDAVVVGAGFAGLYTLIRLRALGMSARVYEAGSEVGGTWYWNRYPGARCDVESVEYSYSFSEELQQEWEWTERFAAQPEIMRYLNHVADRFGLRPDIQLGTRMTAAGYDEAARQWQVSTSAGDQVRARFLIMATGCLSTARVPDIPGLGSFAGRTLYTSDWPEDGVDVGGQRVGVIGTGSSGVQAIPLLAEQAAQLTVFQRTANFQVPARNAALTADYVRDIKARYQALRDRARHAPGGTVRVLHPESAVTVAADVRAERYEGLWAKGGADILGSFGDLLTNAESNATLADFFRAKIRGVVSDPEVAESLCGQDYPLGAKRMCLGTDYYETFNRPGVRLVNLRSEPIAEVTDAGVRTAAALYRLDTLVLATGFDAMTGALLAPDIRGRGGLSLREKWRAGPETFLGLATAGFPNFFFITGPGSPSVISNVVVSIEQHVEWISDHLEYLAKEGQTETEATRAAEQAWTAHVNEVASGTLYPLARSWYTGANVPGKPRIFMPYVGGVGTFRRRCDEVAEDGYRGFAMA
jgi:cation diffusion facilitator CzcD-associated flavoprotein CzcO